MMKLDPRSALVVFSGGQDSTTCLGWALQQFEKVRCVTFNYNQKHFREIDAAKEVIDFFRRKTGREIDHEIIAIGDDTFAGTSPLTNEGMALETYANHSEMEAIIGDRVEKTFVPMRNAVFLMLAANRAAVEGCGYIVTGICQADNANYPDCRLKFLFSAADTINMALGTEQGFAGRTDQGPMDVLAPLMDLSKAESVKLARTLPFTYAALQYSHTAYDGKYPPEGKDHASVLRAHGFEEAEAPDPLVLRAWCEGLMELPDTPNYSAMNAEIVGDLLQGG